MDRPQNYAATDISIAGFIDCFDSDGVLYCTDLSVMNPETQAVLSAQHIESLVVCALYKQGQLIGFVGFDECTYPRL